MGSKPSKLVSKNADATPQSAMARNFARVPGGLLLLGALQCKRASAESFSSKDALKAAVDKVVAGTWSGDDISLWDVSAVDNMGYVSSSDHAEIWDPRDGMFNNYATSFNGDLSKWEVSGVTDM